MPPEASVVTGYEAGRDGFWLHRELNPDEGVLAVVSTLCHITKGYEALAYSRHGLRRSVVWPVREPRARTGACRAVGRTRPPSTTPPPLAPAALLDKTSDSANLSDPP